jgi:hypothetical protein
MAHQYIIGASGSGKTSLAKQQIIEHIRAGNAVCYFDPHGTDTDDLLQYIPRKRRSDVIIFDLTRYQIPWNPLDTANIPRTADAFDTAMRSAYGFTGISTGDFSVVIKNSFMALMEARQCLFGMYLLLSSSDYRNDIIKDIHNTVVADFWTTLDAMSEKDRWALIKSTYTKIQTLMADPRIVAICGLKTAYNLSDIVRDKILFVRLPQGELGVEKAALIGNLLMAQIHQACLSRDTTLPFYWYVDEVHHFAPFTIREVLSGARKFNVHLTGIHQYTAQLDPALIDSFTANADRLIFRVNLEDAQALPKLKPNEIFGQLHELENFQYVRFTGQTYGLQRVPESPYSPYTASARQIDANHRRNLVKPATREIQALIRKY